MRSLSAATGRRVPKPLPGQMSTRFIAPHISLPLSVSIGESSSKEKRAQANPRFLYSKSMRQEERILSLIFFTIIPAMQRGEGYWCLLLVLSSKRRGNGPGGGLPLVSE